MSFELVHSGGGCCNPEILSGLKGIGFNIKPVSTYGVDGSTKEALLIGLLGVCRIHGLAANMPSVTGSKSLSILGEIYNG